MHLEILYKSIGFLCEDKICQKLEGYKLAKEQKRRDEEQRFQMQVQVKGKRGRSMTPGQIHIPATSTSLQSRRDIKHTSKERGVGKMTETVSEHSSLARSPEDRKDSKSEVK